jgi:CHAD domain-containing protein
MAKPLKVKKLAPGDAAHEAAARVMRARLKEFYSRWRDPDRQPTAAELHDLRISGKRLRYSAETLREFYADRLALLLDLLKKIQDVLGEMQDYATERALIEAEERRLAARLERESKPAVRTRIEGEREALRAALQAGERRQGKLFAQFSRLWRGLSHKKVRAALKHLVAHPDGVDKGGG